MKKIIFYNILYLILSINCATANINYDLQKRLNKVYSFKANFLQKILNSEGELIKESTGYL